ncbi:MAG: type III pantothenate kinase [Burkholderiales bacterium]
MWLLIDCGNTRVKWMLHNGEAPVARGSVLHDEMHLLEHEWDRLPSPERVVGCNVAGDEVAHSIELLTRAWRLQPYWLTPQARQSGVSNRYRQPGQLGADRWAALIAARHLLQDNCLVACAGTALTVDALTAEGEFLGGIIAPGFRLMREALAGNTADLGLLAGCFSAFPDNTADAIHSGVVQALVGAVSRMAEEMRLLGFATKTCILSGGDAHLLRPHLNMKVVLVDNLVLEGLLRVVRE